MSQTGSHSKERSDLTGYGQSNGSAARVWRALRLADVAEQRSGSADSSPKAAPPEVIPGTSVAPGTKVRIGASEIHLVELAGGDKLKCVPKA